MTSKEHSQTNRPLVVYGAGDHGVVVAEAAASGGWRVAGFRDDREPAGSAVGAWRVLGEAEVPGEAMMVVAVGDNGARRRIVDRLGEAGWPLAAVVHPAGFVSRSATVAPGVFVGPGVVVHVGASVGCGAIVNSGAVVEHHNVIGECAHIAPGAALGGRVTIGNGALVGMGASVRPGVTVGRDAEVGMGAVVIGDVAPGATVVGNPARRLGG